MPPGRPFAPLQMLRCDLQNTSADLPVAFGAWAASSAFKRYKMREDETRRAPEGPIGPCSPEYHDVGRPYDRHLTSCHHDVTRRSRFSATKRAVAERVQKPRTLEALERRPYHCKLMIVTLVARLNSILNLFPASPTLPIGPRLPVDTLV